MNQSCWLLYVYMNVEGEILEPATFSLDSIYVERGILVFVHLRGECLISFGGNLDSRVSIERDLKLI